VAEREMEGEEHRRWKAGKKGGEKGKKRREKQQSTSTSLVTVL
jgi:hypothetical protein